MENIIKKFNDELIENDLIDFYCNTKKLEKKIDEYETTFKQITLYKRVIHDYGSKYYLQNKQKENFEGIQESLRNKVEYLNHTFSENMYFLNIEKEHLKKENNKHTYNIFKIFIVEYVGINLLKDIIKEVNKTAEESLFTLSNLPIWIKLKYYEMIINVINKNKNMIEYDEINKTYHHEQLLKLIEEKCDSFLKKIYNNKLLKKELSVFSQKHPYLKKTKVITIEELNRLDPEQTLKLIPIYINEKWDITTNILNLD